MSPTDALTETIRRLQDPYWWWVMSSLILILILLARFVAKRSWAWSVVGAVLANIFWQWGNLVLFG